jgi:guanylate kinase
MSNDPVRGNLIVVSAPSGAGKTTLCRQVIDRLAPTIRYSVSHTTRPPRGQERHGVDYFFVDDAEFDRMVAAGELAEWATIHRHRYGTSKAEIDRALPRGVDLFLDIESDGALQIKRAYPAAVLVYVLPPSLDALRERLRGRGSEAPEEVERRLANARTELAFLPRYDYIVINESLEDAVRRLEAVVLAARQRRENMQDAVDRFTPA